MTNNQRNYITAYRLAKKQLPDFTTLVEAGIVNSPAEAESLILDYEAGSPTKYESIRPDLIVNDQPLKKKTMDPETEYGRLAGKLWLEKLNKTG